MTNNQYKLALDEAKRELIQLSNQRQQIEERIEKVQSVIKALSLFGENIADQSSEIVESDNFSSVVTLGLTDAIREILKKAIYALTPLQVRDLLVANNFDLTQYKQMMVPIHNTLKRLHENVEVFGIRNIEGKIFAYKWIDEKSREIASKSSPDDFPTGHPLAGISRRLREKNHR